MSKFSREYQRIWGLFFGRKVEAVRVSPMGRISTMMVGEVVGLCDDGAQSERDGRRKIKPTGQLIIRGENNVEEFIPMGNCRILDL